MARSASPTAALVRLGFADARAAQRCLAAPELAGLADVDGDPTGLLRALSEAADPDLALRGLWRLLEGATAAGVDQPLRTALSRPGRERDRLLAVLGASGALGDHLARHPRQWVQAARATDLSAAERTERLVRAVQPDARAGRTGEDALRIGYREQLLGIAALDVAGDDPVGSLPGTAAALADLAGAALSAAHALAVEADPAGAQSARLAVIAMGKCGGHELNYVSDVDVIFVAEPVPGADEAEAMAAATRLATHLMRACSAATAEGTLWPVDAALRPEGKQGPLVRTVDSHRRYYTRWAKTWEFQALLKARVVAGDAEVGQAYLDAVGPMVWEAAGRDRFVEDVQAMRRRVEQHVPSAEAQRQLKLGRGGLRDIEFAVQLLQLVHGRADERLRSATTLEALQALAAGGYVAREDAAELDCAYRFLRTLEHRIQLVKLRRTHLMPTGEADLRRLGRSLGYRAQPAPDLLERWREQKRRVRQIHERLFYRPLLAAVASLTPDEATLSPEAARARLSALGFRDPAGALRHLESLTAGTNRTAAIQRTLLPVMLGWFADEADPDAGLLAFRQLSDSLGRTHWYLKMLRDEGKAAERLAHVLARSRYASELLMRAPESVRILAEDAGLAPRARGEVLATMRAATTRKDDAESALQAVRVIRRQELFRIVLADLVGVADDDQVMAALTAVTEATLEAALYIATKRVAMAREGGVPADLAVIGMGRLGGAECGYGSDADVVVVHRPHEGAGEAEAGEAAAAVVQELRRLLAAPGPDPALPVDVDLRPEGKAGPLSRTVAGYRAYYERWSMTWEAQALLRARPVAGDPDLAREFMALVDPIRWPAGGLTPHALKEVRRLKARMEGERLPRGADPKLHFKLGPGGLSDVEWTIQLLQMRHAHTHPELRTTSTVTALHVATREGLLAAADAQTLEQAWRLASAMRNATTLWRGRGSHSAPTDIRDAEGVHRILGGAAGDGAQLVERYRRVTRHARSVTERVFYGRGEPA